MRPLELPEVEAIAAQLESWAGSQLQDVLTSDRDLVLEFYRTGQKSWIWIDLLEKCPLALPLNIWPQIPFQRRTRPLQLFLRSHARSRYLTGVEIIADYGLRLALGQTDATTLEIELRPYGANVRCATSDKSVWWRKPEEARRETVSDSESESPRSIESLVEEWLRSRTSRSHVNQRAAPEALLSKEMKKKTKLLGKLQDELSAVGTERWSEAGEWLKAQGEVIVPNPFPEWIDPALGFSENLDRIFSRAKKQKRKLAGVQERIRIVEAEIERLQSEDGFSVLAEKQNRERTGKWLKDQGVQAGHIEIGTDLKFFIGKSGADNLKLLRKARAWDYWLHLKNYPGAHGILQRPKGRVVQRDELERAGQWVISRSLGKKRELNMGTRFELIVAECRHVRPIKGDRLGRVTFRNEQIFNLVFKGEDSSST